MCAQSCLTHCDRVNCSPPGSSVQGTSQARLWVATPSPRGSSRRRAQACVSLAHCIKSEFLTAELCRPSIYISSLLCVCDLSSVYPPFHLLSLSLSLSSIVRHLSHHLPTRDLFTYYLPIIYLSVICVSSVSVCGSTPLSMCLSIHPYLSIV